MLRVVASDGVASPASTRASRACATGHARSSESICSGRRSPGDSSVQPPSDRARWTHSEAAARTAMSSDSSSSGRWASR